MKIVILENPMPAVRMTSKGMHVKPLAKAYVEFKKDLAMELEYVRRGLLKEPGRVNLSWDIIRHPTGIFDGDVYLKCRFFRADKRACDVDNLLKMAMDLLQTAGVIRNDTQVKEVWAKMEQGQDNPRFEMEIYEIN